MAEYPGKTGYPEEYDPRQRPWYRGTIGKSGMNWLNPYIDVGGRGVLLPCTTSLFDTNGEFIGVAGVELTLDYIRRNLMSIYSVQGIEETYLLNDKAEIVVTSSDKADTYGLGTLINAIDKLETYPYQQVVNVIKKGQSGVYLYKDKGREKIVAYYQLDSLGWYFLAEADVEELLSEPEYLQ